MPAGELICATAEEWARKNPMSFLVTPGHRLFCEDNSQCHLRSRRKPSACRSFDTTYRLLSQFCPADIGLWDMGCFEIITSLPTIFWQCNSGQTQDSLIFEPTILCSYQQTEDCEIGSPKLCFSDLFIRHPIACGSAAKPHRHPAPRRACESPANGLTLFLGIPIGDGNFSIRISHCWIRVSSFVNSIACS